MSRHSRVTIDIDVKTTRWSQNALRAYYGLKRWADEVAVRVSSSGSGLHIIGWFDTTLSDDQKLRLRRSLGDDHKRIELDLMRQGAGHTTNVLWTSKGGSGSADTDFESIEDAINYIEMTNTSMKDEAKAVVTGNRRHAMLP